MANVNLVMLAHISFDHKRRGVQYLNNIYSQIIECGNIQGCSLIMFAYLKIGHLKSRILKWVRPTLSNFCMNNLLKKHYVLIYGILFSSDCT